MTITKYDKVAILPKRCDRCNRLFWLEPYNIFYKTVGIGAYSLKQTECQECLENEAKKFKEAMEMPIIHVKPYEPDLDEIKAEIKMYEADCRLQGGTDECEKCNSNVFGSIYRIIDKHKAAVEPQEREVTK